MPQMTLTAKGVRWFSTGHPWIYSSDIAARDAGGAGIVTVVGPDGKFLAQALFSPKSKIALRVLSRKQEPITRDWWKKKIEEALQLRKRLPIPSNARRLVFSEADGLPSLIVDQYGDYLSFQCLSAGLETVKSVLIDLLQELFSPRGIVERSDTPVRDLEGLPRVAEVVAGDVPEKIVIEEAGLQFVVDLLKGQKTGAFLDQRENRILAGQLARGQALDAFSYQGWFACHLAKKAEHVVSLESSEEACAFIHENAKRNGLADKISVIQEDAFDVLREEVKLKKCYDLVNLDPPPFVRRASEKEGAYRGYKEVNLRGLQLLEPGGVIVTSSCSQAVSEEEFMGMLTDAARDAHRDVQLLHRGQQPPDHPSLPHVPESNYLKCFFCRVL